MSKLNELFKHLDKLTVDSKPLWGKMTPQHMVEHLILAVRMSNGNLAVECFNPPDKIQTLKRFLLSGRPLPQNFINPLIGENLLPLVFKSLEIAKLELISELELYREFFRNNPEQQPINATFGPLNKDEWHIFHTKHFEHHLKQFNLIE